MSNGLLPQDEEKNYANFLAGQKVKPEAVPVQAIDREEEQYSKIIKLQDEAKQEQLRQSLMLSVNKNPDQAAQIERLSQQSGIPQPVVERNLAKVIAESRTKQLQDTARFSPILGQQLTNPEFAQVAYDDVPNLSGLEYVLTKGRDYAGSLGKGVIGQGAGTTLSGFGELYGVASRQLEGLLDQVLPNSAMSFLRTPIPWYVSPEQILKRPGEELKDFGKMIGAPENRRGFDTDVIEAIGQLGFQITAALTTGGATSTSMLTAQGADVMAEKTRKDDASQSQKDAAIIAGSGITALTERYGIDRLLNRVPPEVRNRTLRFLADKAAAFGIEFAQEVTEGLLHDLVRRITTNENAPILEGALYEGSVAGVAAAIVRAGLGVRSFRNAKDQENFFRAVADNSQNSKLRERLPERFQDLVRKISEGGPVQNVFIPADQFRTYYQDQGIDPAAKAAELGVVNYTEAAAAGTDVVIPIDQFTAKIAPTDDLQGLFNDLRLSQGDMTAREYERYRQDEDARLEEIKQRAAEITGEVQVPAFNTIKQSMLDNLVATGYEQRTADAYATVYAKTITNLAERSGIDPVVLHQRYDLTVSRPLPDVLTRDTRSDVNIDPLLDRLRAGDLPTNKEIYGKSLTDFLIERGGIQPVAELTDIDLDRGPFQRKLLQPTGMDMDTAIEAAVEAGYLGMREEGLTESDLYDAILGETAGQPAFSFMEIDEQVAGLANQLDQLDQYLKSIGIDIDEITDNAEVRRLIEQASQDPEIQNAFDRLFQAGVADETEQDQLNSLTEMRVSPRLPTAVAATEDVMGEQRLQPDLANAMRDPKQFEKNIGLMLQYPNFKGLEGTPEQQAEAMIAQMVDNLMYLYNGWRPEFRQRSRFWYVGGNRIATRWAERFQVMPQQVAGIIAATSPQKDWFQNVSIAERILEAVINNSNTPWTPAMSDVLRNRDWGNKLSNELGFTPVEQLDRFEGKTMREMYDPANPEMSLLDMAVWIRAWDEANNPQNARVITPEGAFSADLDVTIKGEPVSLRAQSFAAMAKSLKILTITDPAQISEVIGANHKVRSFYNNIIAPYAGDDVTIDTHAVAAALLRPLGSSDIEVGHNFGSYAANSSITGMYGTYGIYAEAYRRAAAQVGVLPREMQSITWEAVRGLFKPQQKTKKNKQIVDNLWDNVSQGQLEIDDVRNQISELVGGIADPTWSRYDPGSNEAAGDSSYSPELPGAGVSGRVAEGVDGLRAGGVDTRGDTTRLFQSGNLATRQRQAKQEYDAVVAQYEGTEQWLRAPNGNRSNLTEEQWVHVRTPSFKQWFGDWENDPRNASQVVDSNGEPLVVYHGAEQGGFTAFNKPGGQTRGDIGIFTTSNFAMAQTYVKTGKGKQIDFGPVQAEDLQSFRKASTQRGVYGLFINLRNPDVRDFGGALFSGAAINGSRPSGISTDDFAKEANNFGFDGAIVQNVVDDGGGQSDYDGEPSDIYIAFDPAQVKSADANIGLFDVNEVNILLQGESMADKRGFIQFGPERKFKIALLEKADLSTFLHESGHFYLEVLGDLAEMPDANQQIRDDYTTVLKFLELDNRGQLTLDGKKSGSAEYNRAVQAHEKFARANEAYLMEGKAPSAELRSIFQRFRNWLKLVYKELVKLNVELTTDVRQVFDRIYATDEEIDAAKGEMSFDALFIDAAAAGMTEAEFEAYRQSVAQATESGKEALQQKLMRELQRERESWWKAELANVREEVTAEVDALPVYQAFKELTEGNIKLNKEELVERFGQEYVRRLPRGFQRVYTTKDGMPLDAAARMLNYATPEAMVEALVGMKPRNEYIKAESDRVMRERHGDMMTDGTIADEAKIALHNTQREKVLASELRALRRKQREVAPFLAVERERQAGERRAARAAMEIPPISAFRLAAKGMIGQTAIRDLEPQRFLNAQRREGKKAFEAMGKGDFTTAAEAKQKEMLNHFLYLEARKAREQSDKIAAYMRRFEKKETRQRIGKAGKVYLEQIDAILDSYEFRRLPNKTIDRRTSLNAFVANQEEAGEPVNIPVSVLEDARQINYRLLSVDELSAVNEAVRNIANLASLKNKLTLIAEKRTLDEVASEAIEHIRANAKGGRAQKIETALPGEQLTRWARGFMLIHKKFATFFRQMDGWQDGGMMWNLMVKPLNARADFEAVERARATQELRKIFRAYRDANMFAKTYVPALGQGMTLQGRLMVALNWGRTENRQRLTDGNGFTQTQIDGIFETLTERDWQFVKDIWTYIDSYWPQISEQYERLYGVPPQKSDNAPFMTKYGMMPGGYFPIKYDPIKSTQAQAQTVEEVTRLMKSGAYVRSQTKNGFTKEVLENLDRAIKLDFSPIYEHVNEVIHDLAMREYLLDTNKLLNHRIDGTTLKDTINEIYGDQAYREIIDTIRDVAAGDIGAQHAFDAALGHLRAGVSIIGMGWNLMTGLLQPLGLTQSIVRIGPKWMAKGLFKWGSDAVSLQNSGKFIYEKSPFMRTRNLTQNREINEIRNQIKRQGKFPVAREAWGMVEDSYFQFIIQLQKLVDFPTWLGAYEKALAYGKSDGDAVLMADQAVIDAQSGGQIKDLAKIQRGSQLMKIWTNFYSYFNTTFNLTLEAFGKTKFTDPISVGRLAVDVLMLYTVPAILGIALREGVNLAIGGDEPDEEELIDKMLREQLTYMMGTMVGVREFATIFDPRFGYSGPAGVRFIAEVERLGNQISQGELDAALRKSAVNVGGMLLHFPAGQVNRIIDGIYALEEGEAESPAVVIFGPPK